MSSKAYFGYIVHAVGAYLYFYPLALFRHERVVKGLITICLGVGQPVAETCGVGLVYLGQGGVDAEAFVLLVGAVGWGKDDTYGQDVEHFLKGYVLLLHLTPYRIWALDAGLERVLHAHLVKFLTDSGCELVYNVVAFYVAFFQLALNGGIVVRVFVLKAEVLKFGLNLVQSQTIGNGGKDVERLACYLVLLRGQHA